MSYDLSSEDIEYKNLIKENYSYQLLHDYIYSEKFINYFLNLFKKDIETNISIGE